MKQVTQCFALLEGENENKFLIYEAYESGVVIFMHGFGNRQMHGFGNRLIAYSDIKRIIVRERVL